MRYRVKAVNYGYGTTIWHLQQKKWWHLRWITIRTATKPYFLSFWAVEAEERKDLKG